MTSSLDSFETALLAELRGVVAERGLARPTGRRPRRRRRRLLAPLGVAAAAVAGLSVVAAPGPGPEPVYAVTEGNDGEVHVSVDRLEDADGLERALAEHGVAADVTYLPDDMVCADGRYRDAPPQPSGTPMRFTLGTDGYRVDLVPGSVRDGETVVISTARRTDLNPGESNGMTGSVGIATGPVRPCVPVPAPPLEPG